MQNKRLRDHNAPWDFPHSRKANAAKLDLLMRPRRQSSSSENSDDEDQQIVGDYLRKLTDAARDAENKRRADDEREERELLEQLQQTCDAVADHASFRAFVIRRMKRGADLGVDSAEIFSVTSQGTFIGTKWLAFDPTSPVRRKMIETLELVGKNEKLPEFAQCLNRALRKHFQGVAFTNTLTREFTDGPNKYVLVFVANWGVMHNSIDSEQNK